MVILSKCFLQNMILSKKSYKLFKYNMFRWQITMIPQDSCDLVHRIYFIKLSIKNPKLNFTEFIQKH